MVESSAPQRSQLKKANESLAPVGSLPHTWGNYDFNSFYPAIIKKDWIQICASFAFSEIAKKVRERTMK